jgi:hypothetical protein
MRTTDHPLRMIDQPLRRENQLKAADHHLSDPFEANERSSASDKLLKAMSTSAFRSSSPNSASLAPSRSAVRNPGHTLSATAHERLAPFVDLECNPYGQPSTGAARVETENPVAELIPDEMYHILIENNLISEKGVRDYIIRKAFRTMKEEQELKSCEALARLQEYYPYLQVDTIRKIIYRIGPAGSRKMMF